MIYIGDTSRGAQILNLKSYFWNTLGPFLGDFKSLIELCYIYICKRANVQNGDAGRSEPGLHCTVGQSNIVNPPVVVIKPSLQVL